MDLSDAAWAIASGLQEHEKRTRRDRFIAAALTGLCANQSRDLSPRGYAETAVSIADAALAKLAGKAK